MLTNILLIISALVVVLLVVASMRPDEMRITRSVTIAAPPAAVFAQVNDFHLWDAWSPWAKLDPACKNTFEGPPAGTGAGFRWDGNNKVGAGAMTITESRPGELVLIRLEFHRPFKALNSAEFTFQPEGGKTLVTWTMLGKNNLISKVFGLFVNCEKMVGKDFETGLATLKIVTETAS
ncbi:MAG: SRPBCC family protein [Verrucomicrobia bacterium]|nr:SRPBCC family protein [Verrucomicrobiota bacterium]